MQIGERTVASFHYTLTNDAGVQDERTVSQGQSKISGALDPHR